MVESGGGHRTRGQRWRRWGTWGAGILACYVTGLLAVNAPSTPLAGVITRIFPRFGHRIDDASIQAAWAAIQRDYVIRDVDSSKGTQGAEEGIVRYLQQTYGDNFSRYLSAADYRAFYGALNGQRTGSIGITLEQRCAGERPCASGQTATELVIEGVLRGQPADRAGLHDGDVLVAVEGTTVDSLSGSLSDRSTVVAGSIRGNPGTVVHLTVRDASGSRTVAVTRADIAVPQVFAQRFGSTVYIQVTSFSDETAPQAHRLLDDNLRGGATSIILDLRDDGGGYVDSARRLASEFLVPGDGRTDVSVRRGRMSSFSQLQSAQVVEHDAIEPGGIAPNQPLVVLIDGNTASAAEIVSLALRDYHRGTLIGERSYGKGSAQQDEPLPDGGYLHLTVDRWYGPNGESIDQQGVAPDHVVALPNPDSRFSLETQSGPPEGDPQLQAALATLAPHR